ncbi:putative ribonuclease H-like domain-containing protein [Tanacetum coccineum]
MNYQPVSSENQANKHAGQKEANHNVGTEDIIDAGNSKNEAESAQDYFVLPIWSSYSSTVKRSTSKNAGEAPNKHPDLNSNEKPEDKEDQVFLDEIERLKRQEQDAHDVVEAVRKEFAKDTEDLLFQAGAAKASGINTVNTASTPVSTASPYDRLSFTNLTNADQDDSEIPALEEIYNNPTNGIFTHTSYDDEGAVADFTNLETIVNVSPIPTSRFNSIHPSTQILRDPKLAVYRNKKDERGVVVKNKARLVAQIHRQEKGIDYDEVFAHVARIKAIRIFLAFASYIGFIVYQMDVKSAFLYGKIDEEVYVSQPPGFLDPKYPKKVYKVVKALYGLHQAPRAWKSTTGGCQFLGRRLISWQCKKQTIMATSTTEAEYVAVANCCGQVLWIHNQMLDYGFNFMNTKIYIDNESTICIMKNPVLKIHTDDNVADLLTKAFDLSRFQFLVVSIGMKDLSSDYVLHEVYLGFRQSLERDIHGTVALMLSTLLLL